MECELLPLLLRLQSWIPETETISHSGEQAPRISSPIIKKLSGGCPDPETRSSWWWWRWWLPPSSGGWWLMRLLGGLGEEKIVRKSAALPRQSWAATDGHIHWNKHPSNLTSTTLRHYLSRYFPVSISPFCIIEIQIHKWTTRVCYKKYDTRDG